MGIKLHTIFEAAGLPSPSMRMETLIAGGDHCEDHLHYEIDPVSVLLPRPNVSASSLRPTKSLLRPSSN
jgi:hypothetical protein